MMTIMHKDAANYERNYPIIFILALIHLVSTYLLKKYCIYVYFIFYMLFISPTIHTYTILGPPFALPSFLVAMVVLSLSLSLSLSLFLFLSPVPPLLSLSLSLLPFFFLCKRYYIYSISIIKI